MMTQETVRRAGDPVFQAPISVRVLHIIAGLVLLGGLGAAGWLWFRDFDADENRYLAAGAGLVLGGVVSSFLLYSVAEFIRQQALIDFCWSLS